MPERYRKPSAQLLQLKYIEKNLTVCGDYLAAKDVRMRIDDQERLEVELQQNQLNDDFTAATLQFEREKQKELELFDRKRAAARQVLVKDGELMKKKQEKRMNVVTQKDSGMRGSRSENKNRTVAYGTSFAHVARDNNFEIQGQLPKLGPPVNRRRMRIRGDGSRKDIAFRPPRAYQMTNETAVMEQQPFFETQYGKTKFMDARKKSVGRLVAPVKESPPVSPIVDYEDDEEEEIGDDEMISESTTS